MIFAFDTETECFRPGCQAPPLVCLTWQHDDSGPKIVHWTEARGVFAKALEHAELLVGHNVAFDLAVCGAMWPDLVPAIFQAYADDRVADTMLREQLYDIATGAFRGFPDERGVWRRHDYNLDACARRLAGIALKKDGWRLRYAEFRDIPLAAWPARAAELSAKAREQVEAGTKDKDLEAVAYGDPEEVVRYPLEDARATFEVYQAQERRRAAHRAEDGVDVLADQFRQARGAWWLRLMSTWGVRTRPEGVDVLRAQTEKEIERLTSGLVAEGLVRADGSRDTKKATARMLEVCGWREVAKNEYEKAREDARPLRRTAGGGVTLDRDACKASDDPVLSDYGERAQLKAVADKDVPMLAAGTRFPVHPRTDIAASGRTTMSAPNLQNLRRLPGIREAIVPRPGRVFVQADYPGLELRTLAQTCFDLFGHSALGDMLNRGEDPHLAFAAKVLGIPYDEAKEHKKRKDVDAARQVGKVFNFGSPGGLGAEKLVLFARKTYDVTLSIEQAREFKQTWLETFPEMREFFAHVARLTDNEDDRATLKQLRSDRIRGGTPYTAACNTYFQGLGADATKAAGFAVSRACYVDAASPIFGSRIANYVHDEFILETDDRPEAHDAAIELSRLLREEANRWLPSVPFKEPDPEPLIMRLWSKEAVAVHDENGRLVPWEPKEVAC